MNKPSSAVLGLLRKNFFILKFCTFCILRTSATFTIHAVLAAETAIVNPTLVVDPENTSAKLPSETVSPAEDSHCVPVTSVNPDLDSTHLPDLVSPATSPTKRLTTSEAGPSERPPSILLLVSWDKYLDPQRSTFLGRINPATDVCGDETVVRGDQNMAEPDAERNLSRKVLRNLESICQPSEMDTCANVALGIDEHPLETHAPTGHRDAIHNGFLNIFSKWRYYLCSVKTVIRFLAHPTSQDEPKRDTAKTYASQFYDSSVDDNGHAQLQFCSQHLRLGSERTKRLPPLDILSRAFSSIPNCIFISLSS